MRRLLVAVYALSLVARADLLVAQSSTSAGEARDTVRIAPAVLPISLSTIVVTASRRAQALADAVVATEVIGAEDVRRSGASDLSAVLTEQTGISLEGGIPIGAGVGMQGMSSERVLVLVDGQPFIGRIAGGLDIARIPGSMVDRVEVVKGPQSTLYGSDAMGGVINVITRAPSTSAWRGGVRATAGTHGRADVSADIAGGIGRVRYSADAGRRTIDLTPGHAGTSGTFANRWDGALRGAYAVSPAVSLTAQGLVLSEAQRWKSGVLYNFSDNLQLAGRAGASLDLSGHRISPTLYATEFRHLSRRSTLETPVAGSGDRESQRLLELEVLYAHEGARVDVDGGVEVRRESIESDRVVDAHRNQHAVEPFVQFTLANERWSLVPGARLAWSDQWGTHWVPRVAAMFRPVPQLALRASAGAGFRAPAFKEQYIEFINPSGLGGYRVVGNPELRPERSRNVSAGVEWTGAHLYARAQTFYNRFADFIEAVELPPEGDLLAFTYDNVADGSTSGADMEIGATWRAFQAEAGLALLRTRDHATGRSLAGRPARSGRASLEYTHPTGLRAALSLSHTGAAPIRSDDGATTTQRAAFTRIDANVSRELPRGLLLSAGVDNLADVAPADWPGFARRQVYLSLAWRGGEQ